MQVRVENLYFLLCYAWELFEERDLVDVATDEVRTAEELFARVLVNATRRLLRQRLDRGYREEVDDLRRDVVGAAGLAQGVYPLDQLAGELGQRARAGRALARSGS